MTKITFFKKDGVYYGFKEQGHTGYGEAGDDILCSALSSMTMLIINTIEVGFGSVADYNIDEETTTVRLIARSALPVFEEDESVRFAVSGLIMAYYHQLSELVEEYFDYLDVKVIDKEPEDFVMQANT